MKQINECKKEYHELSDNCIFEKLTTYLLNTNCSTNRSHQRQKVSNKVFFITLILVYSSHSLVDAYAGNDAVYTIPSQHKSKQLSLMYNFPDDNDWGQKRSHQLNSLGGDNVQVIDYDESESSEPLLHSDSLSDEEVLSFAPGSEEDENETSENVLKRAPSYNSWRKGKRVPSYNSWRKGKRVPSYNSWRKGKRAPSYSSWKNGKRGPSYSSWKSGKRVPSYNSWRKGKRSSEDVIKRASYNAWRKGKRAPSYNSWRKGKRGPSYNSWRKGKRSPIPDHLLAKQGFRPSSMMSEEQESNTLWPMYYYNNLLHGGYHDNFFGSTTDNMPASISDASAATDDDRREKRDATNNYDNEEIDEIDENDNLFQTLFPV